MQETESIDEYILQHIDAESDYLKALYRDTHVKLLRPRMASGHLQGRMLKMFVEMIRPGIYWRSEHIAVILPFVWRKACRRAECCIRLKLMMNKRTLPVPGWRILLLRTRFAFI